MKFSDFPQAVIKENVDYTVKEITNVIKKYGPRESGNENCYAAQKHIKKEMDTFCDGTEFESYKMAPKAFLHFTKLVSVVIFLAVVACAILMYTSIITPLLAQCIVCGVVFVGLFITVMEFLLYKQFMEKVPLMAIFMSWTIGGAIVSFILSVIAIVANFVDMGTFGDFMINYSYIFHFVTALGMVTLFMFVDFNTISPGANDNLTGTYAAVCALRMLDMAGVDFENTEVCAMITDGEEAGLRGCKSWAKNHYDEYVNSGVETVVLCVDTLTDRDYLRVYNKDMTGTVKNNQQFSQLVMDASKDAGHDDIELSSVFFGSSDAAAFSQAGITATCLAAMDPRPADYYHNRRDTADRLVPETIKTGFDVIISTILNFDEKGLN